MTKTYIAFIRDHSGSMRTLARAAARDYNLNLETIKEASQKNNQDTIVSVIKCGVPDKNLSLRAIVEREKVNSNINALMPMNESQYDTLGNATPLFDSVGEAIEIMESVPDYKDPTVAFLVMTITDGYENSSVKWRNILQGKIQQLQATDRWTFAFRVPKGHKRDLVNLGIPEGNILEWELTEAGLQQASYDTQVATMEFYEQRTAGKTATRSFYTTNMANVDPKQVAKSLKDISKEVQIFWIKPQEHDIQIKDFVEKQGKVYQKGMAFYHLTKTEKEVQPYKKMVIREKASSKVYGGQLTRSLLGLPSYGNIKIVPGDHGQYEIFIQSTSTNRKLKENTFLLLWEKGI